MKQEIINIALLLVLVLGFAFTVSKNYFESLKIYSLQAFIMLLLFILNSDAEVFDNYLHIIILLIWFGLRIVLIPYLMFYYLKKWNFHIIERDFKIPVIWSLLIEMATFVCTYFIMLNIMWKLDVPYLISLNLIMFWFITSFNHKKLFWNILSLLLIENGILLLSIFMIWWLPFFVEIWVLVDIIFGFLVSLIALIKIKAIDEKTNIDSISNLKEIA